MKIEETVLASGEEFWLAGTGWEGYFLLLTFFLATFEF